MKTTPILSIVICTRNRATSLHGTLRSLAEIRSGHAWEALIVDNASTDDTRRVIEEAADGADRLRYLRADRIGLGAARDAGWRQARGEIVAFTDDDCYLAPDYVDALVKAFADHPEAGCIGGRIMLHDPQDAPVTIDERDVASEIAPRQFVAAGALQGANLSFRRKALEMIGGVDPDLGAGTKFPCEDIDAVAAALWAGFAARFDPAPVVSHHHRRRGSAVKPLEAAYDRGRGAYYAKYLLRSDTRAAYARGWWREASARFARPGLGRLRREMVSAGAYLVHRRRGGLALLAVPVALAAYCAAGAVMVLRSAKRAVGRRLPPFPR